MCGMLQPVVIPRVQQLAREQESFRESSRKTNHQQQGGSEQSQQHQGTTLHLEIWLLCLDSLSFDMKTIPPRLV